MWVWLSQQGHHVAPVRQNSRMLGGALCLMESSDTGTLTTRKVTEVILLQGLSSFVLLFQSVGVAQAYLKEFLPFLGHRFWGTSLPQTCQHGCATEIYITEITRRPVLSRRGMRTHYIKASGKNSVVCFHSVHDALCCTLSVFMEHDVFYYSLYNTLSFPHSNLFSFFILLIFRNMLSCSPKASLGSYFCHLRGSVLRGVSDTIGVLHVCSNKPLVTTMLSVGIRQQLTVNSNFCYCS